MKNQQDVFTDLRLNRGNDIMFAFNNALTQTNYLIGNIDEANGRKKHNSKTQGYSHITNPIERNLLSDIDQMFNPSKDSGDQFPFMNLNKMINDRKSDKKGSNVRLVQGGQSIISNNKTIMNRRRGNNIAFKAGTIRRHPYKLGV